MARVELHPDFKDFLRPLNSHGVEYLVVGGYAVGYHGYPRATGAMNIWIAVSESNARKAALVLHDFAIGGEGDLRGDVPREGQDHSNGFPPLYE